MDIDKTNGTECPSSEFCQSAAARFSRVEIVTKETHWAVHVLAVVIDVALAWALWSGVCLLFGWGF